MVPFKVSGKSSHAFVHVQSDPRGALSPAVASSDFCFLLLLCLEHGRIIEHFPLLYQSQNEMQKQNLWNALSGEHRKNVTIEIAFNALCHNVTCLHYKQQRKGCLNNFRQISPCKSLPEKWETVWIQFLLFKLSPVRSLSKKQKMICCTDMCYAA